MQGSRIKQHITSATVGCALVVAALFPAVPAAAQGYCEEWTQVLLDTTYSCVSDPRRDRAFGVESFTWKGHDYVMLNIGNEFVIYNIDDPAYPSLVAESGFEFGTAGDSDYDMVGFDVCDDCRYGILSNKVAQMVIFDLGGGAAPAFAGFTKYEADLLTGMVFNHGTQEYAIGTRPASCNGDSARFAINSASSLQFLQCLEVDGNGIQVQAGQSLHVGGSTFIYVGVGRYGATRVFEVVGTGTSARLEYKSSPSGMRAYYAALSIDENNLMAASANVDGDLVSLWDLQNPAQPVMFWETTKKWAHYVSLRSAGPGVSPVLSVTAGAGINSPSIYLVKPSGPELVDDEFWSDTSEPHNEFQACVLDQGGALSPKGDAFYWSRFSLSQVFDLSNCLGPTPAIADVTVTPATVFPGQTVTVSDGTVGSYDRHALWVDEQPAGIDHGYPTLSETNPHSFNLTIPQDVAADVSYTASISVESNDLTPQVPSDTAAITIDRAPLASFTVAPEAVIVGESVTLSASVTGGTPAAGPTDTATYEWEIWEPGQLTPTTDIGQTVTGLVLGTSGEWLIKLKVNYKHGSSASDPDSDGLYEAVWEDSIVVTSVAAAFSITPPDPLNTEQIVLNGLASKPTGGNLGFSWRVYGPTDRSGDGISPNEYTGCLATYNCVIPSDSLDWGAYDIDLTVTNLDDSETSVAHKTLTVGNGAIQPTFTWTPAAPDIGQNVLFTIGGVQVEVDKATWNMGGAGCDGASSTYECTPGPFAGCNAAAFKYASSGNKVVGLTIEVNGVSYADDRPAAERTVTVNASGSCGGGSTPTCTYTLGAASPTFGPAGGNGSFNVFTSSTCQWTATASATWIKITSGASGSGNGKVYFTVDENTGPQRNGYISAGGKVYTIIQKAPYVPANFEMSKPYPDIGEVVSFSVDPALEVDSWNFGEADCKGKSPAINCSFLPPGACNTMEWAFPTSGEKNVTAVFADDRQVTKHPTVQATGECCLAGGVPSASFTVSSDEIFAGETVYFSDTSGKGLATKALGFSVAPADPEIGEKVTFTLSGVTGSISKATWNFGDTGCANAGATQVCVPDGLFNNCTGMSFTYADGGAKQVSVELELDGGATQNAGPVTVNVLNTGSCTGGGDPGGCSYSVSPPSNQLGAEGGTGQFAVNTSATCDWTAISSASWVTVTGSASGTGAGAVSYTVAPYEGTTLRTASVSVEGKKHTVRQEPPTPDVDTDPTAWEWAVLLVSEGGDYEVVGTSTEQFFSYTFKDPGTYVVRLIATNCVGSSEDAKTITVTSSPVEDFVVGAAVSLAGANQTQWETDFRFFNPCGEPLDVRIEYEPENTNNTGAQLVFREFQLVADETRLFSDIVEAIPGLAGEELSGSVRIESSSPSGCKVMSVSRTFNDTPNGSLGLFVPALPVKRNNTDFLNLTGLIHNSEYRTNLRLLNYSDEDVWIPLKIYDHNGNQMGEGRSALVRGHSTKQLNDIAAWLGMTDDISPFSVRADVTGVDVQAFATVVDNLTGDSVLYLSSYTGDNRIWLVGAANLAGVNDSHWRTDLWLYNPTDDWFSGQVEFVVGDNPSDVYGFEWPTLGSHRVKEYLDIVGEELGLEETRGYVVLTGTDGGPAPQVAARTYNLDLAGGTYGLNLRAFGEDDLLHPGDVGWVVGISNSADQNVGFRTNLGLLNTDRDHWTAVRMTLFDVNGGQVGEPQELLIAPGVLRQFDIAKKFGVGDVTGVASLKIEVTQGGGVAAYATEIDNRTQDSIYVPAQRKFMGGSR
jgi:hypothetical protein